MTEFIHKETLRLHKKYSTRDPFELLDYMGATVIFTQAYGRDGLKGYSTVMNRIKYAVINGKLSKSEQKVVAGHEAAHLTLHTNEMLSSPIKALRDFDMWDSSGRIEYEANLFLADFMLEDDEVIALVRDEYKDFFGISRELSVPSPLLAFKLYSMTRRGYDVKSPIDLDSGFLRQYITPPPKS